MGITGLLPLLDKSTRPCHISEFRGGTAAVDSYCWLHKGAIACADVLARGDDSDMYVNFCIKYIKMLLHYDIKPIVVLDGKHLPAKAETEKKRRETRKHARQRAAELLRLGNTEEARNYLRQCIDITPKMAFKLIVACRSLNVDCIVAPYESDSQLAYLSLQRIADLIITDDSDLVLFGCHKILYKMDNAGNGQLVESDKIYLSLKMRPDVYTFDKFRYMCILSGCDYLNSLPGIGLKKALKFIALTAENDPMKFLDKLPRYLNMKSLNVTADYKEQFMLAEATFKHQIVFDPISRKLVPLTNPEIAGTKLEYCKNAGENGDHATAYQVALGNLDPFSLERLDNWSPSKNENLSKYSIWSKPFTRRVCRNLAKEMEKPKLKSTFSEPVVDIDSEEERLKDEYDLNFEKQLKVYQSFTQKNETDEKTNVKDIIEKKESPILTKKFINPFLKKRKSIENVPTCNIVKSRYFQPTSKSLSDDHLIKTTSESVTMPENNGDINSCEKNAVLDNGKLENLNEEIPTKENMFSKIKEVSATKSYENKRESINQPANPKLKKMKLGRSNSLPIKGLKQVSLASMFQKMSSN